LGWERYDADRSSTDTDKERHPMLGGALRFGCHWFAVRDASIDFTLVLEAKRTEYGNDIIDLAREYGAGLNIGLVRQICGRLEARERRGSHNAKDG
jgi:hypothetical protein